MVRSIKYSAPGLLVIAIFFPFFKNLFISTSTAQIFAVISLLLISASIIFIKQIKPLKVPDFAIIYFFVFVLILFGSLYFESPFQRALSDSLRYFIFAWFVIVGYNFSSFKDKEFMKLIFYLSFIQVLVSFLVFFEPLHPLVDPFKGRISSGALSFHFYRFSGTLGFPTEFGCFLFLPIMHLVRTNLFIFNLRYFAFFIFLITGLFLSVSRGAVLVLLVFAFFNLLQRALSLLLTKSINVRILLLVFVFSLVLISILPVILINSETLTFTGYLFSIIQGIDSSVIHRFNELKVSGMILYGDLQVPIGVDRIVPYGFDSMESFWGSAIIKFGWLGVFIIFVINISFYLKYFSLTKQQKYSFSGTVILWFCFIYTFVSPFSEVIFRSKGSVIFGLILGITLSCFHKLMAIRENIRIDNVLKLNNDRI